MRPSLPVQLPPNPQLLAPRFPNRPPSSSLIGRHRDLEFRKVSKETTADAFNRLSRDGWFLVGVSQTPNRRADIPVRLVPLKTERPLSPTPPGWHHPDRNPPMPQDPEAIMPSQTVWATPLRRLEKICVSISRLTSPNPTSTRGLSKPGESSSSPQNGRNSG
jgi:hypothetical protein